MPILKYLKDLFFSGDKDDTSAESVPETPQNIPERTSQDYPYTCAYCEEGIVEGEQRTLGGSKLHRKCLKRMKKDGQQQIKSGKF